MPRHLGLALASLLLLAAAASTASAAPGDRAAAAAIRQATIDLHGAVVAQTPAIRASIDQFSDNPACVAALKGTPEDQFEPLLEGFFLPVVIEMEIVPLQRGMTAFVAKLELVPMRDASLRSGRAAWRVLAGKFAKMAPPPTDVCARLDAWRQAGYPAASRPKVSDPVFDELVSNDKSLDRLDAKLERSGRRLRELGVSKRVTDWWTLTTLLDDIEPDVSAIEEPS